MHINICLLFSVIFLVYGCGGEKEIDNSTKNTKTAKVTPTEVKIAVSQNKTFESTIQAQGKLEARQESALQFRSTNLIKRIRFQNGEYVKRGQLIAQQETDLLQNSLARAEQEVLLKQNAYIVLCCEFNYCLADTAKLTDKQQKQWKAQSGLTLALVNQREVEINLRNAQLVAPLSGRIANLNQKQGELPNLAEPFCKIYNPNSLEVAVEVIESDYGKMKMGLLAEVRVLSEPSKTYQAKLVRTNPQVNENGMVQLHFRMQNANKLLPGMNANVQIRIPNSQNVVIPKQAVVMRSGKAVVFTENKGFAQWNYVTLGAENNSEVEITEGLESNLPVIITNNFQLAHEAPVEIVN